MPKGHSGIKRSSKLISSQTQISAKTAVSIPIAKTIAEANQIAVDLGLTIYADFTGLDLSVANEMIQELAETKEIIPNFGSLQAYGGHAAVQTHIDGKFYKADAAGLCYGGEAISLNHFRYSSSEIQQTIKKEKLLEEIGFHPVGTGSVRGVISHEIGHAIDFRVKAYQDPSIQALFKRYSDGTMSTETIPIYVGKTVPTKMIQALSAYANFDIQEFIAEAWTEYRNNPSPRPVAKQVGDRRLELAKGMIS